MVPLPFQSNAKLSYTVQNTVPIGIDPDTRKPIFDSETFTVPIWLELDSKAIVWDSDESSEYLRLNAIGRAFSPLPFNVLKMSTVDIEFTAGLETGVQFVAQVFPRGTTAIKFPTQLLGDPIRVVGRDKNDWKITTY